MRDPRHPGWPKFGDRTELRDVAERWKWDYVDWCHEGQRARALGHAQPRTLGDATADYIEHRRRTVEPATVSNDVTALQHLTDDHGAGTSVYALDPQRTLDRLLKAGYVANSVATYSAFLGSFFKWLEVPYSVTLPKSQKPDVRCFTDSEVDRLRASALTRDLTLTVDVGLYMGLRQGEIFALEWSDIDLGASTVRVQRQSTKAGSLKSKRPRTAVILPGWTHPAGQGPVVPERKRSSQYASFRYILKDAGLKEPGVGWHALRHTYARLFLEATRDIRLLQSSLGHGSVTTTETTYNHLRPERAAEIAREAIYG